ncbi:hypothetical protein NCLIV_054010 [Neospora caninum Liverpool]|uniref:Uncharacterized protein n=1 Tax=Neospora caninum (strain Liverpool) TaxID=572307 RepID=F0VMM8_NEOCL|nr:hypothetical protein NCLIV_054010 [Neospora caninum Liverpool]CBZ54974.1 hypothetical protein NCLIV_054010 [Neospora caninum Liverpool]CEL69696.1 TPA: hypothetical protein BN1204_054010 [Neospora caninum Liverpool]|eukprot:XP_003885002.1 hypothetical protein NCLIV_054010 [Neospora caninum Liverpool]
MKATSLPHCTTNGTAASVLSVSSHPSVLPPLVAYAREHACRDEAVWAGGRSLSHPVWTVLPSAAHASLRRSPGRRVSPPGEGPPGRAESDLPPLVSHAAEKHHRSAPPSESEAVSLDRQMTARGDASGLPSECRDTLCAPPVATRGRLRGGEETTEAQKRADRVYRGVREEPPGWQRWELETRAASPGRRADQANEGDRQVVALARAEILLRGLTRHSLLCEFLTTGRKEQPRPWKTVRDAGVRLSRDEEDSAPRPFSLASLRSNAEQDCLELRRLQIRPNFPDRLRDVLPSCHGNQQWGDLQGGEEEESAEGRDGLEVLETRRPSGGFSPEAVSTGYTGERHQIAPGPEREGPEAEPQSAEDGRRRWNQASGSSSLASTSSSSPRSRQPQPPSSLRRRTLRRVLQRLKNPCGAADGSCIEQGETTAMPDWQLATEHLTAALGTQALDAPPRRKAGASPASQLPPAASPCLTPSFPALPRSASAPPASGSHPYAHRSSAALASRPSCRSPACTEPLRSYPPLGAPPQRLVPSFSLVSSARRRLMAYLGPVTCSSPWKPLCASGKSVKGTAKGPMEKPRVQRRVARQELDHFFRLRSIRLPVETAEQVLRHPKEIPGSWASLETPASRPCGRGALPREYALPTSEGWETSTAPQDRRSEEGKREEARRLGGRDVPQGDERGENAHAKEGLAHAAEPHEGAREAREEHPDTDDKERIRMESSLKAFAHALRELAGDPGAAEIQGDERPRALDGVCLSREQDEKDENARNHFLSSPSSEKELRREARSGAEEGIRALSRRIENWGLILTSSTRDSWTPGR